MSREEANLFFRLVARRYERASLIITSNKSFIDWGEVFGDQVLATAILDRLLHHSNTINIKGESFRLKEKRRAGLLDKSAPADAGLPVPKTVGCNYMGRSKHRPGRAGTWLEVKVRNGQRYLYERTRVYEGGRCYI